MRETKQKIGKNNIIGKGGKLTSRGPNIGTRKDQPPEPKQGIKRAISSSVSSRNNKYRRPNYPPRDHSLLQVHLILEIPSRTSHLQKRSGMKEVDNTTRPGRQGQLKTEPTGQLRGRSKKATAVRPCPYYLRSRARQPEGFPEERRNIGMESIPQNNIRRRSTQHGSLRRRCSG
ncbi:hypothetical protein TNCV_2239481 [Trichonephila clavipes]|nr:hypothetical protein TNCV_2239481 [Trichonephila clavipes]